ncbi:MAG: prolyl oligopeptidase family serine peptidase [Pseudomonadota bacterium]
MLRAANSVLSAAISLIIAFAPFSLIVLGLGFSSPVFADTASEARELAHERAFKRYFEDRDSRFTGVVVEQSEWRNDAELLYQTSAFGGASKLYIYDAEAKASRPAGRGAAFSEAAEWPRGADIVGAPGDVNPTSPDGRWTISRRGFDLYIAENGGPEKALTSDGGPRHSYADAGLISWSGQLTVKRKNYDVGASVLWSPDSRYFATYVVDAEGVAPKPFVENGYDENGAPTMSALTTLTPFASDEGSVTATFLIGDPETGAAREIGLPSPYYESLEPIRSDYIQWSEDGEFLLIIHFDEIGRNLTLWRINPRTGENIVLLEEENWFASWGRPFGFKVFGQDVLYFSLSDTGGHLYRYDLRTGERKNQVTEGLLHVYETFGVRDGWVYFTAGDLSGDVDPYVQNLYRARLDGTAQEKATSGASHHRVQASPGLERFLVTASTLSEPSVSFVIDAEGVEETVLNEASYVDGVPVPERLSFTAADGKTEIWGNVYKPSDFDPSKKYPVIFRVHGTVGFILAGFGQGDYYAYNGQALAETGAVVLMLDHVGGIGRTRAFLDAAHDFGHQCGGLVDFIAALDQLAATRDYVDPSRVGIYGNSQGGNCASRGILEFPDRIHVATSLAGNHDSRLVNVTELQVYVGLAENHRETYRTQDNAHLAKNLKGDLLLVHGLQDEDVPFMSSVHLISALIEHDKDYDLLIVPEGNHDLPGRPYVMKRVWRYLAEHLGPPQ